MSGKPIIPKSSVSWEEEPLEWPRAIGEVGRLMAALDVRKKRQRRRRIAISGAAALALAGSLWFFSAGRTPTVTGPRLASGNAVVTTPEQRTLPDGSVVELNSGAELSVGFTPDSTGPRNVVLSRGQALFRVSKNPDRPFVVSAGGVLFRAVGTAFSVDLGKTSVEMLVVEGTVAVEKPRQPSRTSDAMATVHAGNRVVVDIAKPVAPAVIPTSGAQTDEMLSWRVPRLTFDETPLREVVRLLNEHSGRRITIASPDLGRVEISGALRADNIEPLLRILESNYRIQVVRLPDGRIELSQGR